MLTATKLSKAFSGDIKAVRNVSLTLEPGRIMALVGASGSGKSTLLNLLAGLADADSGEVRLNGVRVEGPAEVLVAGHPNIRLVHQEYQLMPNVSVRENIAYSLRFFKKNYRNFRIDELLKLCRLTDVQDRTPRHISGGEKQRTAIARAIAEKPSDSGPTVLLLDEPFSHLDLYNRYIVRDLLFDMVRQNPTGAGATSCLFVTHDATDALSLADTLGILRDGKLIQSGAPIDVYRQPVSAYAARMTGPVTLFKAKHLPVLNLPQTGDPDAFICLRPEQIHLHDEGVPGVVRAVYFKGSHYEIDVEISRYLLLRLLTTHDGIAMGQRVGVRVSNESIWRMNG